jgi:hypothetical protein
MTDHVAHAVFGIAVIFIIVISMFLTAKLASDPMVSEPSKQAPVTTFGLVCDPMAPFAGKCQDTIAPAPTVLFKRKASPGPDIPGMLINGPLIR